MNIPEMTDEQFTAIATTLFPRWREDIQEAFVAQLGSAILAARDAQYAALAGQEPVYWEVTNAEISYSAVFRTEREAKAIADQHDEAGYSQAVLRPLYTHPAPTNPACRGDAGECTFNGACMYNCGSTPAAQERAGPVAPAVPGMAVQAPVFAGWLREWEDCETIEDVKRAYELLFRENARVRGALDAAKAALDWYRNRFPNTVGACDEELDAQIGAALSAAKQPITERETLELAEEALGWHAAGFCEDSMPELTVEALKAIRAALATKPQAEQEGGV